MIVIYYSLIRLKSEILLLQANRAFDSSPNFPLRKADSDGIYCLSTFFQLHLVSQITNNCWSASYMSVAGKITRQPPLQKHETEKAQEKRSWIHPQP